MATQSVTAPDDTSLIDTTACGYFAVLTPVMLTFLL